MFNRLTTYTTTSSLVELVNHNIGTTNNEFNDRARDALRLDSCLFLFLS